MGMPMGIMELGGPCCCWGCCIVIIIGIKFGCGMPPPIFIIIICCCCGGSGMPCGAGAKAGCPL